MKIQVALPYSIPVKGWTVLKKSFLLLVPLLLILCMASPTVAASSEVTDRSAMCEELSVAGFPQEFLARRSEEDLQALYRLSSEESIVFGGTSLREPEEGLSLETAAVLTIDDTGPIPGRIRFCTLFIYYDWAPGRPAVRRSDEITVSWGQDDWVIESAGFSHTDRGNGIATATTHDLASAMQGEVGYYATLDSDADQCGGWSQVVLSPRSDPMYYDEEAFPQLFSAFRVEYEHDARPFPFVLGLPLGVMGAALLLLVLVILWKRHRS